MIKLTLNSIIKDTDSWYLFVRPDTIVAMFRTKGSDKIYNYNLDGTVNYSHYYYADVTEIVLENGNRFQVSENLDKIMELLEK